MFDLVLVTVLIVLFIALLVLSVPEGLGELAVRNGRKRDDLTERIEHLEQNLTQQQRQLSRFAKRVSRRYQERYKEIKDWLDHVERIDQTLLRGDSLQFSQLPSNRWVGFHFARHPGDALAVVRTFWRLRQIEAQARACETTLQETNAWLVELETMPKHLQDECRADRGRLNTIGQQLQTEQAWGLRRLDGLIQEHDRLQQAFQQLQEQLRQPENIAHDEAERIDRNLEVAETDLEQLEQRVRSVRQKRANYVATETAAVTAVQELHNRAAAQAFPEELDSLLSVLQDLLQEARRLAQDHAFTPAATRLAESKQLTAFGNQLLTTTLQVYEWQQRQNDALNRADIEQLSVQLQQVYQTMQQQIRVGAERRPSGGLETAVVQSLVALTGQLQQLQTQAQGIDRLFRADVQRLEYEANQRTRELDQAWKDMQRTMRLADGEPLAQHYAQSGQQRGNAKGSPTRLNAYISIAAELRDDLRESNTFLQERLQSAREIVNSLSAFVSTAETEAGQWNSLQQQVREMREQATRIQQIWPRVTKIGLLNEAHGLLDELEVLNQQREQNYQAMRDQLGQFEWLMRQTQEIIDTLDASIQDQVDPKVELRYRWARAEIDCSKALAHLEDAKRIVSGYEVR
jgi:hypothetical protein